ncbi:TAF1 [Symbiodinium necroappetens]|uniref:TAF1 protein n=1 Tax=Symbiodinium necroappetens TaxID=1628268 RepID=A0A813B9Y8_9DINO|nr:TAF1 [Symbiodinium necroappetens]
MAHQRGDFCVVGDWAGIVLDTVCPVMTNSMLLQPSLEEEEEQESSDRPESTVEPHEDRQAASQSLPDRNEITSATPLPSPMFDVPSTPMATPMVEVESPVQRARPSPKLSPSLPALMPEVQLRADFQLPSSVAVRREFWGEMDTAAEVASGYVEKPDDHSTTTSACPISSRGPGGLWTTSMQNGFTESTATSHSELHRLLRNPDFHDFHELLLAGLGLAGKGSESCRESPGSPFWRRCRLLWQRLRPAPLKPESLTESVQPSPCDPLRPPNWARYTAGSDQIRLRSSAETRREVYSFCAQPFWGRLLRPARPKGTVAVPNQVRLPVTATHWSGRSAPTVAELSLRGDQPFVLYEYVEEFPPLLLNVGMSHRVGSYYMPHSLRSYDGQALGPMACLRPVAVQDGTLPGMSARLNPGQGVSIMDSLLQKAPLFRHSLEKKFLLVQSRGLSAWELSLRSLETCCLVGQIEPKKQVPSPWSKDFALLNNECIRHMYLEAKRKWQRESSGDVAEDVEKTLFDEIAESVFQWWPEAKSARAELKGVAQGIQGGGQGGVQQPATSLSELVCLLDAARRGQERLQRLGIELLTDDKKVQKALQELEKLEKHRDKSGKGESDLVFCARWVLEQLQLTPWHLTMRLKDVRNAAERGDKGASRSLAVVGPGDPSSRLEGVSFLPVGPKELAECIELATLQRLSDAELRRKLLASFPESMFRSLGRWDRISLLCRSLGDAETTGLTVTGWSGVSLVPKEQKSSKDVLRQKHANLLQEAFERQAAALSASIQDMAEGETEQKEAEQELLDEQDWLEALAEGPRDRPSAVSAGAASAPASERTRSSRADSDQAELQKMRQRLGISQPEPKAPPAAPTAPATPASREATQVSQDEPEEAAAPQPKPRDVEPELSSVKVLKVVTLHKSARGFKEKVMYVVGQENIQLYRELHAQDAPRMLSQEPPAGSKQKTRTLSGVSDENGSDGDSGDGRSRPGPRSSLSAGKAQSRDPEQRESKRRKTSISGAPSDVPHSTSEKSDSLLSSQALDPQSDRAKKRLRLA